MVPELDLRMIGHALSSEKMMMTVIAAVENEYFHQDCRLMWSLVSRCFKKYKEIPTSRVLEKTAGSAWKDAGLDELYSAIRFLINNELDEREFPMDLEEMKRRRNAALLVSAGKDVFQKNFVSGEFTDIAGANRTLKDLVAGLDKLYAQDVFREGSVQETAQESWEQYTERKANPDSAAGIHLGFPTFDRITNGMRESELLLIGGESGTGKSALSMNMCVNAWLGKNKPWASAADEAACEGFQPGKAIVYFTIEMPFEAMLRRLHACVAGIPLRGIRDGKLSDEDEARYRAALRFIKNYPHPFHIIDIPRGASMQHVEVKYLEFCHRFSTPPDLQGLDYISLMTPDRDEQSDWLNVGRLAEQLHEFGRVHGVPSISPVQLNRPPKKDGSFSRPDQERIGRSIMLTQNANIVLTIEKRKDEHLMHDMRVHIIKMRDGEQGLFVLQKRLDRMRLYEDVPDFMPHMYTPSDGGGDAA